MKKYFIMLLVMASVLTACMSKTMTVEIKEITGIRFKNNQVNEKDFDKISKIISKIKFQNRKMTIKNDLSLFITTKENIYKFMISSENHMKYTLNDTIYYSKDEKHIQELKEYLESLPDKYKVQSYYHSKIDNHYKKMEKDVYIKLENDGEKETQVVIEAKDKIFQLKVHDIEYDKEKNNYIDIDLVKDVDTIEKGNRIVVKGKVDKLPSWRIEIQNEYGYKTTFLPYYDEKLEEVVLKRVMDK